MFVVNRIHAEHNKVPPTLNLEWKPRKGQQPKVSVLFRLDIGNPG